MKIHELHYSNTNTYLIEGEKGKLLFDTGWAGTFPAFCRALGEMKIAAQDIDFILISHYHPDHMGIAQEIGDQGGVLLVPDVQEGFLHAADHVFEKEKNRAFIPVRDDRIRRITIDEGTAVLNEIGIGGRIIHTPGHSEDSISLFLDSGDLFVGDLNPLYELEAHKGTEIEESWNKLLALKPRRVHYGHAKTAVLENLKLVVPALEEMWFRESLMADEETMAYNHSWGGTIPFPREQWAEWYDRWIVAHDNKRFYRYLKAESGFVGEVAYHYDTEYDGFVADVIIFSKFRGKGYGAKGLEMLCAAAKENGISVLYDDIAIDNTAIGLFLKQGFYEEYRTNEKIVLKKEL